MGRRGLLYVGDGKMGARETRASLQAGGDCYLCPWSELQLPPAVWERYLAPVATGDQPVTRITRLTATGPRHHLADGYERLAPLRAEVAGQAVGWTERRLVVRSRQLARAGERALRTRLAQAQAAVTVRNARGRGKRRCTELPALQAAVEAILTRYRVQGWLAVQYTARVHRHRLRRYGSRPATVQGERHLRVQAVVDRPAVATAMGRLGGRVDATHAPPEQLSLAQAVLAYRSPYRVESHRGRLKGQPLSLTPLYLPRDDHATGLIRRLSLGWRVLTLRECVVRQRVAATGTGLAGVSTGPPKRGTARPPTERLRTWFEGLTLTIIREGHRRRYHLTPLSAVHRRILRLLNFPVEIYTRLCPDSQKPPSQ